MRKKDEDKRDAIVAATLGIVMEHGVVGIKMAGLARKVGISPSTLYVYFKDKDDLVSTIFTELVRKVKENTFGEFEAELPFKVNLKNLWLRFLTYRIEHHQELFFIEQVKKSPYYGPELSKIKDDEFKETFALMDEGKRHLLLKDLPNEVLYAAWDSMTIRISDMVVLGQLEPSQENLENCFGILWDAVSA